jgi:hypothetical protein
MELHNFNKRFFDIFVGKPHQKFLKFYPKRRRQKLAVERSS